MGAFKNVGLNVQEYLYDFAVDGGVAAAAISLSSKAGYAALPVGAIVMNVIARVVTTVLSGGSATVEWGNTADTDGYSGVAVAKATLVANYLHAPYTDASTPAALLWDNTNDHMVPYAVTATTNTQDFKILINVADLTAGKILFLVQYLLGSV